MAGTVASPSVRRERARRAVELAEALLREARAGQTHDERARAERLARLMEDPRGKELTIALTDQAFRSRRPERIADQLHYLLERYGAPRFMEWWERIGLTLGALMGQYLPSLVVPPIVARLRHETESLILPGEDADLRRYLAERRAAGIRLNLNQLGEAILGEAEAARRLEAYLALLARDDVEYISVKVSSVSSQIDLTAFRHTVEVVKDRLRTLYRQAQRHHYRHPDGRVTPKFVNLDMEEYRDLDLTVAAFREVLDEDEFHALPAGIVLQAYLPESHRAQRALVAWALARGERGGAPIKLRIVKGANLAMERIEADGHGWPQAPYAVKGEVDANFKRMVEYGCRPEHAPAVHLGIASHNLFDVAYGLLLRAEAGIERWVEFEMLEGMANHQARVVQARAGGLLLYAPVVRAEDFHSAIAYLVRRLDENTAPDNFLRHVFGLEPGSPDWVLERDRFLAAFDRLDGDLSDAPRRTQDRAVEPAGAAPDLAAPFVNEPDTDWALPANRDWIDRVREAWRERPPETVPLQIAGELVAGAGQTEGRDRSRPGRVAYRHGLADRAQLGRALDAARAALAAWAGRPPARAARAPRRRRGDARPPAGRPDRRHDRRRRQDGGRGGPRGVRGDRLRALLRARPRPGRRRPTAPAWSRSAWSWWRRPGTSRSRSRRAGCWPRWPPATRCCSSPRPRRCWSAGTWPARSGTRASRARPSSSFPCATTRSAASSSPTHGWTASSSPARWRRRAASSTGGRTWRCSRRRAARTR